MTEIPPVRTNRFPVWGWYVLGAILFVLLGFGVYRWITPSGSDEVVEQASPSPSPTSSPTAAVTDPVSPTPSLTPSPSPTTASDALQKAEAAYTSKNYSEAIAQYKLALDQESSPGGQASIWNKLGNAYRDDSKRSEALASYATAYQLDAHLIVAYQNRANLYVAMGQKEVAKSVLEDGLVANPNNTDLNRDLSTLQLSGVED